MAPELLGFVAEITFDGTISFGAILAGIMVSFAIGGASWANNKKIALGLAKIDQLDGRLVAVEAKVDNLPVVMKSLVDGEKKMDDHEHRIRDLERVNAKA